MWKWSGKDKTTTTTTTKDTVVTLSSSVKSIPTSSRTIGSRSSLPLSSSTTNNNQTDEKREEDVVDESVEASEIEIENDDVDDVTSNKSTDGKSSSDVKASFESVAKVFSGLFAGSKVAADDKKSFDNCQSTSLKDKEENQKLTFFKAFTNSATTATSSSSSISNVSATNTNDTSSIVPNSTKPTTSENLGRMLVNLMKSATTNNKKNDQKEQIAITDIVAHVRSRIDDVEDEPHDMGDPNSMKEIIGMFNQYKDLMKKVANKYVGDIDFKRLTPTAIFYYLEKEDEIKNPSWKRRQHRFCDGIDMKDVKSLNESCEFAMLSYADTVDEIRDALTNTKPYPYELVFAELRSSTGQPASFVAVKNDPKLVNKSNKKKQLDVIIVVRGTKTAADAFTDLLCDSEPYQGGKAHSFIVTSGIYIADKHRRLLLDLLDRSGASVISLKLIGHSLGAGAASIAGMEFNNEKSVFYSPKIKATVVGFGCPALVSEELAKKSAPYITTVVNDSDVVPRMSGISVANMLRNVLEFDWREYAKKDIDVTLKELERAQPILFRAGTSKAVQSYIESLLNKYGKDLIVAPTNKSERLQVELYPPGKVLHFYNDGRGISASFVPNTFFNEIDVTRRMIDDHLFFSGYQATFLAVAREKEQNHHYRFDIDK